MPFNPKVQTRECPICGTSANVRSDGHLYAVDCARCGDFGAARELLDDWHDSPWNSDERRWRVSIASYFILRLQDGKHRAILDEDFFRSLTDRTLPTPAEVADNLLIYIGDLLRRSPGEPADINILDMRIVSEIGGGSEHDIEWLLKELRNNNYVTSRDDGMASRRVRLTLTGWERFEELRKERAESKYAFLARKFDNPELDGVVDIFKSAVAQTGFDLRIVSQKAGLIDSIIEYEIRGARFLISELSDDNAGAYWEAGFAEGLGKPVIYICREGKKTHFDTEHRHTIRWHPDRPDESAEMLKAVIRNTLLGDAKQTDD